MGTRGRRSALSNWGGVSKKARRRHWSDGRIIGVGLMLGTVLGLGLTLPLTPGSPLSLDMPAEAGTMGLERRFGLCHVGGGQNCVVDGDTIWLDGTKIRIADIDAPETHPPRCPLEAELGARATSRLQQLLNAGPITLVTPWGRGVDKYGRQLRTIERDGQSLGEVLVREGLARRWEGRRRPWCE